MYNLALYLGTTEQRNKSSGVTLLYWLLFDTAHYLGIGVTSAIHSALKIGK